jgi:hypothetical protein
MVGEILNAILNECQQFYKDTGGTVILKTDFKSTNLATYRMPLLMLEIPDAVETGMFPGGLTRAEWLIVLNAYNYQPNATLDDLNGYTTGLLNVVDDARRHFSNEIWLAQGMTDAFNNYGMRFTLSGIMPADALDQDGLVMGYKIVFDTIAFDTQTDTIQDSTSPLTILQQTDQSNVIIMSLTNSALTPLKYENINQNQIIQIAPGTFIESIISQAISGSPVWSLGTTAGGVDLVPNTTPGTFNKVNFNQFYSANTTLYLTVSGGTINISFLASLQAF